jgi:hypothetical protein
MAGAFLLMPASAHAASLYLSPGGSDAAPCTAAAPCQSFDRAYHVAHPGDVVEVAAGSYADQTINDDASKDGQVAPVWIRGAAGATPVITDLLSYASNVHYQGFKVVGGQPDVRGGHDVTVEDMQATNFYITGPVRGVTFRGGDYGPYVSTGGGAQIKTATAGGDDPDPAAQPQDILIDGVSMHDYTVPSGSSAHLDCLHVFYHARLTVRNSRFENCKHYGILLGSNGTGQSEGDVIENNFFGGAEVAGFGLRGGPGEDFDNVVVRYNSGGIITPQTTNGLHNVVWLANAANDIGTCRDGLEYRLNVVTTGGCGPTDRKADPAFVAPAQGNFHLKPGSPAIDRGDPSAYPADDIDRHGRFAGAAPDVGAHEFGATGPPGPPTPPANPSTPAKPVIPAPTSPGRPAPDTARQGGAATTPAARLTADVAALGDRLTVSRRGVLRLKLRCTAKHSNCRARVLLRARLHGRKRLATIGSRSLVVRRSRTVTFSVRLRSAALRSIRRHGPLRARLLVSLRTGTKTAIARKDVRLVRSG